jgi:hypothetical protein
MSTDQPDTVLVDDEPQVDVEPVLPDRTWSESPLLWVSVVVVMLISIPAMLEYTRSGGKAAPKAPVEAQQIAMPQPVPAAPVADPPRPMVAPPRPTPQTVVRRQPEPARQTVIKCKQGGRTTYTQTGACAGQMAAVPIDTERNLVDAGRQVGLAAPVPRQ